MSDLCDAMIADLRRTVILGVVGAAQDYLNIWLLEGVTRTLDDPIYIAAATALRDRLHEQLFDRREARLWRLS